MIRNLRLSNLNDISLIQAPDMVNMSGVRVPCSTYMMRFICCTIVFSCSSLYFYHHLLRWSYSRSSLSLNFTKFDFELWGTFHTPVHTKRLLLFLHDLSEHKHFNIQDARLINQVRLMTGVIWYASIQKWKGEGVSWQGTGRGGAKIIYKFKC